MRSLTVLYDGACPLCVRCRDWLARSRQRIPLVLLDVHGRSRAPRVRPRPRRGPRAYIADEAFFTGTAAEVTPIREVDNRKIGTGGRGPVTEKLQTLYFDVVHGRHHVHPEWLAYVNN